MKFTFTFTCCFESSPSKLLLEFPSSSSVDVCIVCDVMNYKRQSRESHANNHMAPCANSPARITWPPAHVSSLTAAVVDDVRLVSRSSSTTPAIDWLAWINFSAVGSMMRMVWRQFVFNRGRSRFYYSSSSVLCMCCMFLLRCLYCMYTVQSCTAVLYCPVLVLLLYGILHVCCTTGTVVQNVPGRILRSGVYSTPHVSTRSWASTVRLSYIQ